MIKVRKRMVMCLLAAEANIAELAIIKLGKRLKGLAPLPPPFEGRVQCQQAIDCQQDDVIVP